MIVAGFGPVGRAVTEMLEGAGLPVTLIERNARTVATQSALGRRAVLGDICDPDVLREAGIEQADAIILTIPNEDATVQSCVVIRSLAPAIFIAVRTNHVSGALRADQAGADHVTVEEIVTAESMQRAVLLKFVDGDPGGN